MLEGFADLPSSNAVQNLYDGKDGAVLEVVASTALRALLLAGGMRAAGIRNRKTLVRGAVGGALALELFVFLWVGGHQK